MQIKADIYSFQMRYRFFIQRVGKLKFDHGDFQLTIKALEQTFILIRQSAIKSKLHALRVLFSKVCLVLLLCLLYYASLAGIKLKLFFNLVLI